METVQRSVVAGGKEEGQRKRWMNRWSRGFLGQGNQ